MFLLDKKDFKYLVKSNLNSDIVYKISVHLKSTLNTKGWGYIYKEDFNRNEWWDIIQTLKKHYRRDLYKWVSTFYFIIIKVTGF